MGVICEANVNVNTTRSSPCRRNLLSLVVCQVDLAADPAVDIACIVISEDVAESYLRSNRVDVNLSTEVSRMFLFGRGNSQKLPFTLDEPASLIELN